MSVRLVVAALFAAVCVSASADDPREITCEGGYPHHLQGVASDGTNVYWSFTTVLVKTDRSGRVLSKDGIGREEGHMGDLCCKDGKVFVGMNMGVTKDGWRKGDEVWQYDGATLKREKTFPTPQTIWCNNGLEWFNGYFWVIGSAPKRAVYNIVFKYSPDFRFCGARYVASGWTNLGVQTICRYRDLMLFGCYGTSADEPGAHPGSTFAIEAKALTEKVSTEYPSIIPILKRFASYTAEGIMEMDGRLWSAHGIDLAPKAKNGEPRWSARLVPDRYSSHLPERMRDVSEILSDVNKRLEREFIGHDGLLLDYVGEIPTAEEIADLKPNAMGWWSPIENGSMFTGEWLPALMAEGPRKRAVVERCVRGLIKMSEVSDVPGFIARGTGTDGKSHHPCGSNDQTDPWFLGLCEYCRWPYADATLKAKASERLVSVARALETNGWRVPCDGSFKGQNRGKLNGTSMPFWCVTRFCYMLKSLHLLTGDAHWGDLYSAVKTERLHEIEAGGAIDEKILKACYGNCVWIYLSSAQALALLIKMEENPSDREKMKRGLSAYADRVAYLMKDRVKYENTVERPFRYANWRNGYAWRIQKTQKEAEAVAYSGKPEILGGRKDYERSGMANPLAAAAICALAGDAKFRAEILATLNHFDYSTPNISEFFHAAVAAAACR